MARYLVRVVESTGRRRAETVEARDAPAALRAAEIPGRVALEARPVPARRGGPRRIPARALADFATLAASLLGAGLTLRDALRVVAESAERKDARSLALALGERIDAGAGLGEAFDGLRPGLPPACRGLVRVGERVGAPDGVFARLAARLESEGAAREKLAGALAYPAIVLSLAVLGLAGLAFWVLPRMEAAFAGLGGAGASFRDRVAAAGAVAGAVLAATAAAAAALPLALARRARDEGFAAAFDGAVLGVPVLGPILAERACLDFAFAMEALLAGGLPLGEALREAAASIGNRAVAREVLALREGLDGGVPLSRAAAAARRLPRSLAQWFAVGERTGKVEAVFGRLRAHYQRSTDRALERALALVEPAVILAVGLALLGAVVLFVVPLFGAYGSLL